MGKTWKAERGQHPSAGVDPRKLFGYFSIMSHKVNDNISLELGRRTAERLRLKPELRQIAVDNLDRWKRQNCKAPSLLACYDEWRKLLDQSLEDICAILTAENDESQRLRQNSPFAGVLSPQEVWEVKQRFRHAAGAA